MSLFNSLFSYTGPLLTFVCLQLKIFVFVNFSFHVGSECFDSSAFYFAVESAKTVFNEAVRMLFAFCQVSVH